MRKSGGAPVPITKASLLGIFVEGAQLSDGLLRYCALTALNEQLGIFQSHRGQFTTEQVETIFAAAHEYMSDPANQIVLSGPIIVRDS